MKSNIANIKPPGVLHPSMKKVPYYRKLTLQFALILLNVNFRALNFQYFNSNFGTCLDILDISFPFPVIFHLSQKLRRRFTIFRVHLHRYRCQTWCQLSFEFFWIQCWNKFVPVVTTNCVLIALISFVMKFYLLFRVNFLYSKVVFH